jgi:LmbE family N-acetylglucosaminyl deacetylase
VADDYGITWGVLPPGTFERVLVFSPHFDDAAMGAGHLLLAHPGATVVTVFAGPPDRYPDEPTEWDALGGFRPGDDVVARRREEDVAALAVLGVEHEWLDFVDHQYLTVEERATPDAMVPAMTAAIDAVRPTAVVLPMGLANPDHVVTHDAGMLIAATRPDITWFGYEDAGYKHIPGMLAHRVSKLFQSDFWPTPMIVPTRQDHARKRAAIECYTSQLGPLNADHALAERIDGNVPEQFWMLAPPPPGWERMREL